MIVFQASTRVADGLAKRWNPFSLARSLFTQKSIHRDIAETTPTYRHQRISAHGDTDRRTARPARSAFELEKIVQLALPAFPQRAHGAT